eukprot:365052-Chlamydomonas_euryale.AAC.11
MAARAAHYEHKAGVPASKRRVKEGNDLLDAAGMRQSSAKAWMGGCGLAKNMSAVGCGGVERENDLGWRQRSCQGSMTATAPCVQKCRMSSSSSTSA